MARAPGLRGRSRAVSARGPLRARGLGARGPLRALSTVLIVAGVLLLGDVAVTLLWQEPLSALYAQLRQDSLGGDLRALERAAPTPLEVRALGRLRTDGQRVAFLARSLERDAKEGSAVGRIRMPRIGVNFVVIKGTSTSDLRNGPGVYPQTRFPGVHGTTAIAGHRTTYLAPFRDVDKLRAGDQIEIDMPYARFTYATEGHRIVSPNDFGVIDTAGYDRLVLSACHPLYSASQRIVVFARLVRMQPQGAARRA